MMRFTQATMMAGLLGFAGGGLAATLDGAQVPLHRVSAETCKDCHKEIYKQWKGSMHANASALNDPIHGGVYRKLIGDPTQEGVRDKQGHFPVCLQCHAPSAALDGVTKLDAEPVYNEGITCVSCHGFAQYKGVKLGKDKAQVGIAAYEMSDQLQGPMGFLHDQGKTADALRARFEEEGELNPHLGVDNQGVPYMTEKDVQELDLPMQGNPALQSSEACLGCHEKLKNAHGIALCATGEEFAAGKSQDSCQSCHLPTVDGVTDHSMAGGHDPATVKRAVGLNLAATRQGDRLAVVVGLKNKEPHNVPTGAPFRNMYVKVTALDAQGQVLWQNFETHPIKEDPQAFIAYLITGAEGEPVPPPMASKVVKNSLLTPYEQRDLSYDIPAAGVDSVRAELYFNLLWPGQVKQMKKLPDELKEPKRVAWTEVRP